MNMVEYLPMSTSARDELLKRFPPVSDPEIIDRRRHIVRALLSNDPEMRRELTESLLQEDRQEARQEGRLTEARAALRRVLALRQLAPSKDDDARIEACAELATLERWLDQAVTAATISDALA